MKIIVQKWEEADSWHGITPYGYSMHLTMEDRDKYTRLYGKHLVSIYGNHAPEIYDRTSGTPYIADIDYKVIRQLQIKRRDKEESYGKYGIRRYSKDYPRKIL